MKVCIVNVCLYSDCKFVYILNKEIIISLNIFVPDISEIIVIRTRSGDAAKFWKEGSPSTESAVHVGKRSRPSRRTPARQLESFLQS